MYICEYKFAENPVFLFLFLVTHQTACLGIWHSQTLLMRSVCNCYSQSEVRLILTRRMLSRRKRLETTKGCCLLPFGYSLVWVVPVSLPFRCKIKDIKQAVKQTIRQTICHAKVSTYFDAYFCASSKAIYGC